MKRTMTGLLMGGLLLGSTAVSFAKEPLVNQRQERQQQRIGNGVKSGQLTAGETSRLEKKETNLNKQVRADRQANGGNLTNNEKTQINKEQNVLSKDIYKDKHNAATQQH